MEEVLVTVFLAHSFHNMGQNSDGDTNTPACSPTLGFFPLKIASDVNSHLPRAAPELSTYEERGNEGSLLHSGVELSKQRALVYAGQLFM